MGDATTLILHYFLHHHYVVLIQLEQIMMVAEAKSIGIDEGEPDSQDHFINFLSS